MQVYESNSGEYVFVGTEKGEYTFDTEGNALSHPEEEVPGRVVAEAKGFIEYRAVAERE